MKIMTRLVLAVILIIAALAFMAAGVHAGLMLLVIVGVILEGCFWYVIFAKKPTK